jgi:hypothetical protein
MSAPRRSEHRSSGALATFDRGFAHRERCPVVRRVAASRENVPIAEVLRGFAGALRARAAAGKPT